MFDIDPEVGEKPEKYKPLFFISLLLLLAFIYYQIFQENRSSTEIIFETEHLLDSDAEIYVDISGAVQHPGVYKLSVHSRFVDLLSTAGGISKSASVAWVTKNLNLSQKLFDEQKVYVPFEWDVLNKDSRGGVTKFSSVTPASIISSETSSGLIAVNSASSEDLKSLSGVGETYAERIINTRPHESVEDLINKAKIPKNLVSELDAFISFQ